MALRTKDGRADKGVSLARGPALVLGSILLTFGLILFLADGSSPTDGFPDGTITEFETFLGFDVNDWTALITAAAGGLLLFGAAQHLLAKTMSLIVGLALGACSVIALVDGDDVLGLAAANGWVALGWGIAAAFLLINTLLPRKGGKDTHDDRDFVDHDRDRGRDRDRTVPPPRRETVHREERVETRPPADREPVTRETAAPRSDAGGDIRDDRVVRDDDRAVRDDDRAVRDDERIAHDNDPKTTKGRFARFGRGPDSHREDPNGVVDDRTREQR